MPPCDAGNAGYLLFQKDRHVVWADPEQHKFVFILKEYKVAKRNPPLNIVRENNILEVARHACNSVAYRD